MTGPASLASSDIDAAGPSERIGTDIGNSSTPGTDSAPPATPAISRSAAYAPALNSGFQAAASRVQDIHHTIANQTFGAMSSVPGMAMPTRVVQGMHDAITQGVFAAMRHGGGAAWSVAGGVERLVSPSPRAPDGSPQTMFGALNAAFGNVLAASGSGLSIRMGLYADGVPLGQDADALSALGDKACLFIHGLACDEQSWAFKTDAWSASSFAALLAPQEAATYGALLQHEFGLVPVALRYNTGLAIDANAAQLSVLLEKLVTAAPQLRRLVLVGHSMGGLVARRAIDLARQQGAAWPRKVPMLICLGSPQQGAPLGDAGSLAAATLASPTGGAALADIADGGGAVTGRTGSAVARSGVAGAASVARAGRHIKGARRSAGRTPKSDADALKITLKLVYATLGEESDAAVGRLFGDGLVMRGGGAILAGEVDRAEVTGLGHMSLLNHPRVYTIIREWIEAALR